MWRFVVLVNSAGNKAICKYKPCATEMEREMEFLKNNLWISSRIPFNKSFSVGHFLNIHKSMS